MLTKPGEFHDIKGVPVYPGDLIRSLHFKARRKTYYLYHVAIFNTEEGCMEIVPVSELEPTLKGRGGRCWMRQELLDSIQAVVMHGHGPGDTPSYEDRKRVV